MAPLGQHSSIPKNQKVLSYYQIADVKTVKDKKQFCKRVSSLF